MGCHLATLPIALLRILKMRKDVAMREEMANLETTNER